MGTRPARNSDCDQVTRDQLRRITEFSRAASDDEAVSGSESALPRKVVLPMAGIHVKAAIDLEDQRAAVVQSPLAVGEPKSPTCVPATHLASRKREVMLAAHSLHVDLAE